MFILSVEVWCSTSTQALEMFNTTGSIDPGELKGVIANRNITAFSIAIKLPFVLFLIFVSKKYFYKFLYSFNFCGLFCLSMIESRASFIAAALIVVILLLWTYILSYREKNYRVYYGIFII